MARLPESFNVGDRKNLTPERLLELLEDMYQQLSTQVNQKPNVFTRNVNGVPTAGDDDTDLFVQDGDFNIKTDDGTVQIATRNPDSGAVTWKTVI